MCSLNHRPTLSSTDHLFIQTHSENLSVLLFFHSVLLTTGENVFCDVVVFVLMESVG